MDIWDIMASTAQPARPDAKTPCAACGTKYDAHNEGGRKRKEKRSPYVIACRGAGCVRMFMGDCTRLPAMCPKELDESVEPHQQDGKARDGLCTTCCRARFGVVGHPVLRDEAPARRGPPQQCKIVTWNIQNKPPLAVLTGIEYLMQGVNADIIALQECASAFCSELHATERFALAQCIVRHGYGCSSVSKNEKQCHNGVMLLVNNKTIALRELPLAAVPALDDDIDVEEIWVEFAWKACRSVCDRLFLFVCAHYKPSDDSLAEARRRWLAPASLRSPPRSAAPTPAPAE